MTAKRWKEDDLQKGSAVIYAPDLVPALAVETESALSQLIAFLQHEAKRSHLSAEKIEVRRFLDPEDGSEEIVVTQWLAAPAGVALDYWERLGSAVESWSHSLPKSVARVMSDQVAIEVRWLRDG